MEEWVEEPSRRQWAREEESAEGDRGGDDDDEEEEEHSREVELSDDGEAGEARQLRGVEAHEGHGTASLELEGHVAQCVQVCRPPVLLWRVLGLCAQLRGVCYMNTWLVSSKGSETPTHRIATCMCSHCGLSRAFYSGAVSWHVQSVTAAQPSPSNFACSKGSCGAWEGYGQHCLSRPCRVL